MVGGVRHGDGHRFRFLNPILKNAEGWREKSEGRERGTSDAVKRHESGERVLQKPDAIRQDGGGRVTRGVSGKHPGIEPHMEPSSRARNKSHLLHSSQQEPKKTGIRVTSNTRL